MYRYLIKALQSASFQVVPFQSDVPLRGRICKADALLVIVDGDVFAETAKDIAHHLPELPLFVICGAGQRPNGLPKGVWCLGSRCDAGIFLAAVQNRLLPPPGVFDGMASEGR